MTTLDTRAAAVVSETQWLLDFGEDGTRIAARLGYSEPRHLARALNRWGRDDLARRVMPSRERVR